MNIRYSTLKLECLRCVTGDSVNQVWLGPTPDVRWMKRQEFPGSQMPKSGGKWDKAMNTLGNRGH